MVVPNTSLCINEVQSWPIAVPERSPDGMLIVHRDRVIDPHLMQGRTNVVDVFLKSELRRMNADHYQSVIPIFLGPGADIRKRPQPIDAGVGPEVDEDDFSAQSRRDEVRRIQPRVRTLERNQLGLAS